MAENASNAMSADEFNNSVNEAENSIESTPTLTPQSIPVTKKPKSTRVKVGHKNTEAINPKYIKSVADWVAYCDRGNVILGADGSLQVRGDDGSIKTIPFQKGFDAIRGINMRSEILRKKSADRLVFLQQQRRVDLSRLQDEFVSKERELLDATRAFRESVSGDADGSLAAEVVKLNKELTNIHAEIQNIKYSFQTPVVFESYMRKQLNYATYDDRVIFLNQNINMETTALMRTLGLDGEPLPEVEDADEESEEEEESTPASSSSSNDSNNDTSISSSTPSSSNDSNNDTSISSSTPSSSNDSNNEESSPAADPYFEELVDEIKTKLHTFTPSSDMTLGQLKAAIFTEERLAYYNAHIPDFRKRFTDAYLKATKE